MGGMGGCSPDLKTDVDNCGECGRMCVHDKSVELPRCIEGVCKSFCESGFVNITEHETGFDDDGCEAQGRRVFVTEGAKTASEVGGVTEADGLCQMLADEALLGGSWAAWLSEEEDSSSPSERFNTIPDAPYMLLDFRVVAASWAVLVGGQVMLENQIDLTENMLTPSNPPDEPASVWTGTTPFGLPSGKHCSLWTSAGKDAEATVGSFSLVTEEWTETKPPSPCDAVARLYCFEQ